MAEIHYHKGIDAPKIDARDLSGPSVIIADTATGVSAQRLVQPSIIQRGIYHLSAISAASATQFVTFPQSYSEITTLQVLLTPNQNATHYLQGIATSGFTVSGAATDQTGSWLSIGYK